ncbi:hypothetical protein MFU01_65740 [Myxococcus fulvus]|uniref:Uncharacterized protein n=1 Tax=Myxococcus fulvus TaxID=33 RepID=A0A511TBN8_MYXFU|nr:hypothetical protein MFU01_65740 [Myxococcus fulvus]
MDPAMTASPKREAAGGGRGAATAGTEDPVRPGIAASGTGGGGRVFAGPCGAARGAREGGALPAGGAAGGRVFAGRSTINPAAAVGGGVRADGLIPGGMALGGGGVVGGPTGSEPRGPGKEATAAGRPPWGVTAGGGRPVAAGLATGALATGASPRAWPHSTQVAERGGLNPSQFGQTTERADNKSCDMGGGESTSA